MMNYQAENLRTLDARSARAMYPPHQIRCGIILVNTQNGHILTVREKARDDFIGDKIGLPKGVMEDKDRDFFECASREFREEIGIDLRDIDHCYTGTRVIFHNKYFHDIIILFVVLVKNDIVIEQSRVDSREIAECVWMSVADFLREDSERVPRYIRRLACYLLSVCEAQKK